MIFMSLTLWEQSYIYFFNSANLMYQHTMAIASKHQSPPQRRAEASPGVAGERLCGGEVYAGLSGKISQSDLSDLSDLSDNALSADIKVVGERRGGRCSAMQRG